MFIEDSGLRWSDFVLVPGVVRNGAIFEVDGKPTPRPSPNIGLSGQGSQKALSLFGYFAELPQGRARTPFVQLKADPDFCHCSPASLPRSAGAYGLDESR